MRHWYVVAAAHDDVEPRCPGDAGQCERVAADAQARCIDQRHPARVPVLEGLVYGHFDVPQAAGVVVVRPVGHELAQEVHSHRRIDPRPLRGLFGHVEVARQVDEQVLVHDGDAQRLGLDSIQHGLDLSRLRRCHGVLRPVMRPPV